MKRTLLFFVWLAVVPTIVVSQTGSGPTALVTPPPSRTETPGSVTGLVTAVSNETITVKSEAANPISFAVNKSVRYVDKGGKKIKSNRVRPGARVRIYYEGGEDTRTATKIILGG
jgi:hypothetical protein